MNKLFSTVASLVVCLSLTGMLDQNLVPLPPQFRLRDITITNETGVPLDVAVTCQAEVIGNFQELVSQQKCMVTVWCNIETGALQPRVIYDRLLSEPSVSNRLQSLRGPLTPYELVIREGGQEFAWEMHWYFREFKIKKVNNNVWLEAYN